ncbi:hypothetical protein DL766_005336 [Monosporascus sp. MC13-8B]|uniref:Uncharacterized protein n=1 Tax=Monosporascus cannonballus TaxID=155416 RepID=A0ABY0H3C8_9PEZI|nr:hypothetical protein DL762_007243 [Monosporascus cannonballus]RYO95308.1 hypothetical protein DL763_003732 [Monosporascus cannonballus]RYP29532.1 hypothetical protein DL766_005336 [Monosporascus sp. MC13-8B]
MAPKRSPEDDGDNAAKRRRDHTSSKPGKQPGSSVDQTYGQKGVFGTLEGATTVPLWDSDLDCEDDSDALAYLKSVRVEASGIPHVLAAKKAGPQPPPRLSSEGAIEQEDDHEETIDRSIYEDGIGDSRGYYHDGAYTALPEDYDQDYDDEEEEDEGEVSGLDSDEEDSLGSNEGGPHNSSADEIREAYFASLTRQYLSLRKVLRRDPPQSALSALTSSNPTFVGKLGPTSSTMSRWSGLIKATDPLPAQIAGMHKDSVVRLIRVLLNSKSFREGHELRERTSRWIWALLARLPDRGELDYQEIGWIRELGKRAVLFMVSLAEREVLHQEYGVGGSGESDEGVELEVDEGVNEEPTPSSSHEEEWEGSTKAEVNDSTPSRDDDPDRAERTSVDTATRAVEEALPDSTSRYVTEQSINVNGDAGRSPASPAAEPKGNVDQEHRASEASHVEMQLDSDLEDGEVSDESQKPSEDLADIESAKVRLLTELEAAEEPPESVPTQAEKDAMRAQINLRATLNMILTVAGEFYGQRDLLEFRNPFSRLSDG